MANVTQGATPMTFSIGDLIINLVGGGVFCRIEAIDPERGFLVYEPSNPSARWFANPELCVPASRNHLWIFQGREYFGVGKAVHSAPIDNMLDVVSRQRLGSRFECWINNFNRMQALYTQPKQDNFLDLLT
jgi:hypothetical protein